MRFLLVSFLVFVSLQSIAAEKEDLAQPLLKTATGLNPQVLQLALKANACAAKGGVVNGNNILTVIDYSLPSTKKRLWTFDLQSNRLLYNEFVAHGMKTGENFAKKFSNQNESQMTSLGLYKTANPYIGKNGYSLRLIGLEKGFNDNVYSRAVVFHGAWYVSEEMIKNQGRLGRSYGCPAVRREIATPMIDTIKDGSLMFVYYPDSQWLHSSHFVNGC